MECGAGTAAAAAPGRGHRPGTALGATGAKQVTFRRRRPPTGRSWVPAQAAGGTCNLGGRGPGPSDTPPRRPGLPGRRALTCTASRLTRGLLGLGCADRTALGVALGVPRGARQEESGGRRRPGRRRRRRTPALRSRETHPPPSRSAAAAADHFRGAGQRGGAPAGTSCPRGRISLGDYNKGSPGAGGDTSGTASRWNRGEPAGSRGSITSQVRAGVPVLRCFRVPRTWRVSWRKKGRGRPPSCFWGAARFSGKSFLACSLLRGLSQIKSWEVDWSPVLVGGSR